MGNAEYMGIDNLLPSTIAEPSGKSLSTLVTGSNEIMPAAKTGRKLRLVAFIILATSSAALRTADSHAIISEPNGTQPIDGTSNEQHSKQTCAALYRLDDVTEMNDEMREVGNARTEGDNTVTRGDNVRA